MKISRSYSFVSLVIIILNQNSLVGQTTRENQEYSSPSNIQIERKSGGGTRTDCDNLDNIDNNIMSITENRFFLKPNIVPSTPLHFSITEPKIIEPLYYVKLIIPNTDMIEIKLPDNLPLEKNKDYVWTAGFYCNSSLQWYQRGIIKLK